VSSRKRQPGVRLDWDMALAKEELAQRMRSARSRAGRSQQDIAEAAGVSLRQYNRYETAQSAPREKQLPALADALEVDVSHLQEPQQNTLFERLELQATNSSAMVRSALGLLDQVLDELRQNRVEIRLNRDAVAEATAQITSRLEVLETRVDVAESTLSQVQRDFLRSLGAPVPPPAAGEHGQARGSRSTSTGDSAP
jgi:transcriptional regulator with XRE-family HTH domain